VQVPAPTLQTASLDTPLECLRCILPGLDLRTHRDTAFELNTRVRLIAVWGPGGFRRSRNGEEVLLALEKLFSLLEFAAPPLVSVVELLKSSHSPQTQSLRGSLFCGHRGPGQRRFDS
jgi:hypothetical protein